MLTAVYSDLTLLLPAMGLVLLYRAISRLNPEGVTLVRDSLSVSRGSWRCSAASAECLEPCAIQKHGQLASVLWLECHREVQSQGRRSSFQILIFPDALSFEHWRLLRRELRLEGRAREP